MSVLTGRAKKFDGTAIDYVSIFNWTDGKCIAQITPDAAGIWEHIYYKDLTVGITYVADGCEPITHGAYAVEGVWEPPSFFTNDRRGAWYKPSDLSTLFQDAAGTTPVTGDGQPIGLIKDKSGNGNHLSQATASKKPIYKTDGVDHWLQFNGGQFLIGGDVLNIGAEALIHCYKHNSSVIYLGGKTIAAASPARYFIHQGSSLLVSGFNRNLTQNVTLSTTGNNTVTQVLKRGLDGQFYIKENGVVLSTAPFADEVAQLANTAPFALGGYPSTAPNSIVSGFGHVGKIFEVVIALSNDALSEINQLETYMAG